MQALLVIYDYTGSTDTASLSMTVGTDFAKTMLSMSTASVKVTCFPCGGCSSIILGREVRSAPPSDKAVRLVGPALLFQKRRDGLGEAFLDIDDGSVLVEGQDFDVANYGFWNFHQGINLIRLVSEPLQRVLCDG
jgi:hypothetical protein